MLTLWLLELTCLPTPLEPAVSALLGALQIALGVQSRAEIPRLRGGPQGGPLPETVVGTCCPFESEERSGPSHRASRGARAAASVVFGVILKPSSTFAGS